MVLDHPDCRRGNSLRGLSRNRADDALAFDPVQDAMKHDAYQAIASLLGPPRL